VCASNSALLVRGFFSQTGIFHGFFNCINLAGMAIINRGAGGGGAQRPLSHFRSLTRRVRAAHLFVLKIDLPDNIVQ
jgi:hypothetical protein